MRGAGSGEGPREGPPSGECSLRSDGGAPPKPLRLPLLPPAREEGMAAGFGGPASQWLTVFLGFACLLTPPACEAEAECIFFSFPLPHSRAGPSSLSSVIPGCPGWNFTPQNLLQGPWGGGGVGGTPSCWCSHPPAAQSRGTALIPAPSSPLPPVSHPRTLSSPRRAQQGRAREQIWSPWCESGVQQHLSSMCLRHLSQTREIP